MSERWRPAREWESAPDDVIDVWRFDLEVQAPDWAILTPDEVETARRKTKKYAREWYAYADEVDRPKESALELCVVTSGSPSWCEGL